jgi:hypothetical protein
MNLNSVAPVYDRAATQRMFNDLALDLTRSDAELTNAVRNGNRVGSGWDTWFKNVANQVMDARDAYMQLVPADDALTAQLRSDALDLAASGGQLGGAYRHGETFGSGWDTTLDRKINDVRLAADRLNGVPTPPPLPPVTPPQGGLAPVSSDAKDAAALVRQSIERIRTVPVSDKGDASTKDARIAAFNLNMQAQKLLEQHFQFPDAAVTSQLHTADAHLEDANWQLAKKPSPDGRFTGVDIPGALRDSEAAAQILDQIAASNV